MLESKRYSLKADDGAWGTAGAGGTASVNTASGALQINCPAAGAATTWDGVAGFNGPSIYHANPGGLHGRHILYRARVDPTEIVDADGRLGIFFYDYGAAIRYAIFTDQSYNVTASVRPAAAAAVDLRTTGAMFAANPLWLQLELWGGTVTFLASTGGAGDVPPPDGQWIVVAAQNIPGAVATNGGGAVGFGAVFFTVGAHAADEHVYVRDPALIGLNIPSTW